MIAMCLMLQIMHAQTARNIDKKIARKAWRNAKARAASLVERLDPNGELVARLKKMFQLGRGELPVSKTPFRPITVRKRYLPHEYANNVPYYTLAAAAFTGETRRSMCPEVQ